MTSHPSLTSKVTCVLMTYLLLHSVDGSEIRFNSSSRVVNPLMSSNLTLSCILQDTTPPGTAISQRSVPRHHDVNTDLQEQRHGEEKHSRDVTASDDLDDLGLCHVTQTADNVQFVMTMVISRDGVDLASLSENIPVKQLVPDVTVSGHLTSGQGERGRLQITWAHPSLAEAGSYTCEVGAVSPQGHSIIFSQNLDIAEAEVSLNDLVDKVNKMEVLREQMQITIDQQAKNIADMKNDNDALNHTIDQQAKTIQDMKNDNDALNQTITEQAQTIHDIKKNDDTMEKTIAGQAKTIQVMKNDNDVMNRTIHSLIQTDLSIQHKIENISQSDITLHQDISLVNQSLSSLIDVARVEPSIFFSAYLSSSKTYSHNQVVIYDKIWTNEGQSYNNVTGIFHCPLDGFYFFQVNAFENNSGDLFSLELQLNDRRVMTINMYGNQDSKTASNSVIVRLRKNDQVKVVIWNNKSKLYASSSFVMNTFSGRLVSLV